MVFKTNRITNLLSKPNIHFLTNTFCYTHSSHPSRLSASYFTSFGKTFPVKILGYLSSFSRTSLTDNDEDVIVTTGLNKLFFVLKNR